MTDAGFPPLPDDDDALEALMQQHLDPVTPSAEVRASVLASLSAGPSPSGGRWAGLAVGLLVGALGLGYALAPGGGRPERAPEAPAQPSEPAEDPAPSDPPAEAPAPTDDPGLRPVEREPEEGEAAPEAPPAPEELTWTLRPGAAPAFEADEDYAQLSYLLEADSVVLGEVRAIDPTGAATLRGVEVLSGEAAAWVSTAGEFTGCEGVPSFEPYLGRRVALFLRNTADGVRLLHGSAGIQPVPFRGLLDAEALRQLVAERELSADALLALVEAQGVAALHWLERQLSSAARHAYDPRIQAVVRARLDALTPESRRDEAMALVRYMSTPTPEQLERLKAYHATFVEHRLGSVVRGRPSYANRVDDHLAFLSVMARHDMEWVVGAVEGVLAAMDAGEQAGGLRPRYLDLLPRHVQVIPISTDPMTEEIEIRNPDFEESCNVIVRKRIDGAWEEKAFYRVKVGDAIGEVKGRLDFSTGAVLVDVLADEAPEGGFKPVKAIELRWPDGRVETVRSDDPKLEGE